MIEQNRSAHDRGAQSRGGRDRSAQNRNAPDRGAQGGSGQGRTPQGRTPQDRGADDRGAPELIRLQKVLANAGVASRRASEDMIRLGRVKVDGLVVREMGVKVDPDSVIIHVDDDRIIVRQDLAYFALNKMPGTLSTMADEDGRYTVGDLLEEWGITARLFHVGRLDIDSEGLLLLTNDGELAHRLTHPSFRVPKTYMAEVPGPIPRDLGRRLRRGIELDDGPVKIDEFDVVDMLGQRAVVKVVIHEGRKRLVRRMLEAVDHPVSRLVRTELGGVKLGHQRPGTLRKLNPVEISKLYGSVGL